MTAEALPCSRGGCSPLCAVLCPVQMVEELGRAHAARGALEEAHLPGNFGSQASARLLNGVCSSRAPKGCQHLSALVFSGLGGCVWTGLPTARGCGDRALSLQG